MRLSRRGRAVVAVLVFAFLAAYLFGGRALNAVVVPGVVALAAGYVQVRVRDGVTVDRTIPGDDYAGETGTVTLSFADVGADDVQRPFVGTVRERVGEGLSVADGGDAVTDGDDRVVFETAVGAEELHYEVRYEERGERTFGPATVTATDVLGLFERDLVTRGTASILVYPRIHRLSRWGREHVLQLEELGRSRERNEYEELREYDPGDPLRDVHWKTTAKRDELVVMEFAAEVEAETIRITAGASADGADGMAEAVASLAFTLTGEGVPVEVHMGHRSVEVGPERSGIQRLLRLLAVVGPGRVPDVDGDLEVRGTAGGVTVTVGDREFDFAELTETYPAESPRTTERAEAPSEPLPASDAAPVAGGEPP